VIFSGIQPTSIPHIGNYFGAIKQWITLQESISSAEATVSANSHQQVPPHPLIVSIVDLHAITVPRQSKLLK
jgi:tryptophanyl-tRNA synthetase